VKIYVAAVRRRSGKKERGDETEFTTEIGWWKCPVISFRKISFPVTHLMPYYAETGRFHVLVSIL
jgi:hypothetical protein